MGKGFDLPPPPVANNSYNHKIDVVLFVVLFEIVFPPEGRPNNLHEFILSVKYNVGVPDAQTLQKYSAFPC